MDDSKNLSSPTENNRIQYEKDGSGSTMRVTQIFLPATGSNLVLTHEDNVTDS